MLGSGIGLSYGLSAGLSYGVGNGLQLGLSEGFSEGLMVMLASIVLNVSLGTLRFTGHIRWRWQSLLQPQHLRASMIVICLVFLLYWLSYWLSYWWVAGQRIGLSNEVSNALSIGLSTGLSYWLLLGLYQGLVQEHIEDRDRHQFNQGIHRSLRNGVLMSVVSASIISSMGVFSGQLRVGPSLGPGLVWLLVISSFLLMWAMSGGLTILRHYLIRWLLARSHHFPWHAQPFLEDATARILLLRVGGGYRFLHRRLLDYFADLHETTTEAHLDTTKQKGKPTIRQIH